MNALQWLVMIGGYLHFTLLPVGAMVPFKLDFRGELRKVNPLLRELVWEYYVFIAQSIVAFGILSIAFADVLVSNDSLGRALCAFIGIFWTLRLVIALFVFNAKPQMTHWFFRAGYHVLTAVFIYLAVVYSTASVMSFLAD